jgi:hypothetical protein
MKKYYLFLIAAFLLVSGCATKQPLYTWDKYPSTLYQYKKSPTDENLQKHKDCLDTIMKESAEKNLRVPPGIYCEYGFLLLKEGKKDDAVKYFDLEAKTYPEASVFVQNLKSLYFKKDDDSINKTTNDINSDNVKQEVKQ